MRMHVVQLLIAAAFVLIAPALETDWMPQPELRPVTERVPGSGQLSFGTPLRFWNEQDSFSCFPLNQANRRLALVWRRLIVEDRVIVSVCEPAITSLESAPGEQYGIAHEELLSVRTNQAAPLAYLRDASPPGWTSVSNPNFSADHVAYWAIISGKRYAAVYDLNRDQLLHRVFVDQPELATDNRGHFPQPFWNSTGSEVSFPAGYGGVSDEGAVLLTLQR
jgi:hypothetical protein